jgi:hypothetical protein
MNQSEEAVSNLKAELAHVERLRWWHTCLYLGANLVVLFTLWLSLFYSLYRLLTTVFLLTMTLSAILLWIGSMRLLAFFTRYERTYFTKKETELITKYSRLMQDTNVRAILVNYLLKKYTYGHVSEDRLWLPIVCEWVRKTHSRPLSKEEVALVGKLYCSLVRRYLVQQHLRESRHFGVASWLFAGSRSELMVIEDRECLIELANAVALYGSRFMAARLENILRVHSIPSDWVWLQAREVVERIRARTHAADQRRSDTRELLRSPWNLARSGMELVRPSEKDEREGFVQEIQQPSSASKCDKEVFPDDQHGE